MKNFTRIRRDDGLWNFLKPDGTLLSKEWFERIWGFEEGFAIVQREGILYKLYPDGKLCKEK